jgi:hypothetical protein
MNRVGNEKAFVYTRGRKFRLTETIVPCAAISHLENDQGEPRWNESRWTGTVVQDNGR